MDNNIYGETPDQEPLTVTKSGAPVTERIQTIQAARSLFEYLVDGSLEDSIRRARIKGQIDGNPPYNPERLAELNLGYTTNVNFLEGRAIMDQKAGAAFELFFEVPTLVEIRPAIPNPDLEPTLRFGEIMAEEFSTLLLDWPGFLLNMDQTRRQADCYGFGVMLFRDEWDWRPSAYDTGNFFPPPMAKLDIEKLTEFGLYDSMTAGELFAAISNEKVAEEEGWDVQGVKDLLVKVYLEGVQVSEEDKYQRSRWEAVQQRVRNGDWQDQKKEIAPIEVAHVLVTEWDTAEVSHYIFLPRCHAQDKDTFLFRKPRRFKKMTEALWLLPYNNADTYIKSCRGLGSMIESHCDLSNRFLGRTFDAGFTSASLLLQPATQMDLSKMQLLRLGIMTIIPPGLNWQQSTFAPQVTQLIQLRDLSSNIMKNNTGVYRQNPETYAENQPMKTARQVVEEVAKEARLEKANIAFDLYAMTQLYREIFRRVTNKKYIDSSVDYPGKEQARRFVKACEIRGVPRQLLFAQDFWKVTSTRPIGMGSWGTKMDIARQVFEMRYEYDEAGRINAARDLLAVLVGNQNVDRYKPMKTRDAISTNEHSIASIENSVFTSGAQVPVGSDQGHAVHFIVHAKPILEIVQLFEETKGQGIDLQKAAIVLQASLPHAEEHLRYLSVDPSRKDMVEQGTELLNNGVKVFQVIQGLLEKMAKIQQQREQEQQAALSGQSEMDKELQIKAMEAQANIELASRKLDSLNANRDVKTAHQLETNRQRAAEDLRLKAARQAAELQMDQVTNQAKAEAILAKARASTAG